MAKAEFRTSAYDAIIIGTGQAGPSLARRLATARMRVAIVERKLFGGTCVNTGCIPTKTLIASAYAIHMARRAADFGVVVDGPVRADMARVKARKDTISRQSRSGLEESLKALQNCTIYRGHARFASPHAPDDSRRPRCRKGRDPRLHEDAGRCRQPGNPRCGD